MTNEILKKYVFWGEASIDFFSFLLKLPLAFPQKSVVLYDDFVIDIFHMNGFDIP